MIRLAVSEYCDECPRFDPVCNTMYTDVGKTEHCVSCMNSDECRNIYKYLKTQMEKENKYAQD